MHVTFEDDEFFKRKFETKKFSIKIDKMSEKDIEECKRQFKSSQDDISNGISCSATVTDEGHDIKLSRRYMNSPDKKQNRKDCDCNCNDPDEEYYKEKFHIQECLISLPRMNESSTNKKRKLAFIFDYLTFCFLLKICFSIVIAIFVLYFL